MSRQTDGQIDRVQCVMRCGLLEEDHIIIKHVLVQQLRAVFVCSDHAN